MRTNRNHYLKMENRPLTLQRQLLLRILHETEEHLDAKELYRRAIEKDHRISLATVYRNLRLFKELGLIDERRLDDTHYYYEIKRSAEHYHLVCTSCGEVIEFKSPLISKLVLGIERSRRFHVTRAVLYLEGHCPECNEKEKRTNY